jgi:hypothetical protein
MPNARGRRRRFGSVRQLRSGQWQARYQGPDGILRPADHTFPTKTQAEQWLTRTEADMLAGDWTDPDAALITFREYATDWIDERPGLRPKTIEVYKYVLGRHLLPGLGARSLSEIKEAQVRRWRRSILDGGASPVTAAKAYRLLKAIMNTAVDDGLIRRNPCRIKGAAQDRSPERAVLTVRQVFTLASVIDPRYRAMALLVASSPASGGASWPRSAGPTSTSRPAPSGYSGPSLTYPAGAMPSGRRRPMLVVAPLSIPS